MAGLNQRLDTRQLRQSKENECSWLLFRRRFWRRLMVPSCATHQDSRSSNRFGETAHFSFNLALVIGQFGLFSRQLLDQTEKLLVCSCGGLGGKRSHRENSRD